MTARSPVRFKIKGSSVYVEPQATTAYQTTGTGRRSIAMRASNFGPNAALDYASDSLRSQARDADRKNGLAKIIADRLAANIVGAGIMPQPKSPLARALWAQWTDEASADGTLDFYGLQAQIARTLPISGECFVRLRTRRSEDRMTVPLQLQVLESDFVPMEKNETLPNNRGWIRQGIEFNAIGKRVAYWMYRQHPADRQVLETFNAMPERVPASEVLHIYDAFSARPGQVRGVPWITQVLAKLKSLDVYDDAELERKKTSSLYVGSIKRTAPAAATLDELKEIWGDEDAEDDGGAALISAEPGTINILDINEEMEWNSPQDVGGMYEVYKRDQHRLIAAMTGLLYEQLTGDFSDLNDRTWRAAMNEFKRRAGMWQHHIMAFQLCRPVWSRWGALAKMTGALRPAEIQPTVPWIPEAWPYINPKQDIEANEAEIRAGLASRSQKASERGYDSAEIDDEQAADNARADKLGLKYDSDARQKKAGSTAPVRPTDEDDDEAADRSPGRAAA